MSQAMSQTMSQAKPLFTGKDLPLLPDGSTYHLGAKAREIFPRILCVGTQSRAELISSFFDVETPVLTISSKRGFNIFSGLYKGVGVSIISIGMGAPMVDFMMREATYVQPGPMAVIRLGTCGIFNQSLSPGTVLTAGKGSMYIYANYARLNGCVNDTTADSDSPCYLMTKPVMGNQKLNDLLVEKLKNSGVATFDGLNATCETFYSCQGRNDAYFNDGNENIVEMLASSGVDFVEMEIHPLFHLAAVRRVPCYAAAAAIGILNRTNSEQENISEDALREMEAKAGECCLQALTGFELPTEI